MVSLPPLSWQNATPPRAPVRTSSPGTLRERSTRSLNWRSRISSWVQIVTEVAVSCRGPVALLCSNTAFYYTLRHDAAACGHTGGQRGGGRL